jgi:aromatic ring-opening dioxygenase catalytic subunit (LigB family)
VTTQTRLPTYFLSHGGGPWPWLKAERGSTYDQLEASLHEVRRELRQAPRAVLMISGHWEADRFLLSSAAHPPMEYDYYGFPEHTYHIRYDAPGAPALADAVRAMIERGGVAAGLDPQRGFDHGTFTLMHTMYPEADLPLLQLSIRADYDPAEHLKVGELIAPLRDEGGSPCRASSGGPSDPPDGRGRRGRERSRRADLSRERLHGCDHRL